jgi:hypothetical protein
LSLISSRSVLLSVASVILRLELLALENVLVSGAGLDAARRLDVHSWLHYEFVSLIGMK